MTLSITIKNATLSIMTLNNGTRYCDAESFALTVIYTECHIFNGYAEYHYAECCYAKCRGVVVPLAKAKERILIS
jgi:hypothetical protein